MKSSRRISALNAILIAIVSACAIAGLAAPSARAASLMPADQCDMEASSAYDRQRNPAFAAVEMKDIRTGIALSACREAVNHGAGLRQQFQLARALQASGATAKAVALFRTVADRGYAAAMVELSVLQESGGNRLAKRAVAQPVNAPFEGKTVFVATAGR